jgi:hypothetical protein
MKCYDEELDEIEHPSPKSEGHPSSLELEVEDDVVTERYLSCAYETVIAALLVRVGGRASFTVGELARAVGRLETRDDAHTLSLWLRPEEP